MASVTEETQGSRPCAEGGRDGSDSATAEGHLEPPDSAGDEAGFSLGASEGRCSYQNLDLDCWPAELGKNKFLLS